MKTNSGDLLALTAVEPLAPFTQRIFFYDALTYVNCVLNLLPQIKLEI